MGTEGNNQSARNRKKIERLFGEAMHNLAMKRRQVRSSASIMAKIVAS